MLPLGSCFVSDDQLADDHEASINCVAVAVDPACRSEIEAALVEGQRCGEVPADWTPETLFAYALTQRTMGHGPDR